VDVEGIGIPAIDVVGIDDAGRETVVKGQHGGPREEPGLGQAEGIEAIIARLEGGGCEKAVVFGIGEPSVVEIGIGRPHLEEGEGVGEIPDPARRGECPASASAPERTVEK